MNSLNRDMNQQNKTERWEELKKDFNRVVNKYFGEVSCRCGSKESVILEPKEFTEDMWSFILQLLSDARREEREAIALKSLLIFPNLKSDFPSEQKKFSREFIHKRIEEAWLQFDSALTTAEERIKSLFLPDQEQLTIKK